MQNGFTSKSIAAQTLSEKLQEARKKRDISLDKLAHLLNIKKSYLEMLEGSQYHKLPAEVYTQGYLKNLAEYLGLDANHILSLYKKERGIEKQLKKEKEVNKRNFKTASIIITPHAFRLVIIILIVLTLFFYLWYEFSGLSRPPKLSLFEPVSDKTTSSEIITIIGQADPDTTLSINGQPIYIDPQGNFSEKIGLQQGLNILKIQARNRLGKESVIERKIMVEKSKEKLKGKTKEEKREDLELIVTVREKATWLHVKTDDKVAYSGTMLPDSRQIFLAKEKITLSTGKGSSTYLIFNDKDLGPIKAEGDVVRDMEFTK